MFAWAPAPRKKAVPRLRSKPPPNRAILLMNILHQYDPDGLWLNNPCCLDVTTLPTDRDDPGQFAQSRSPVTLVGGTHVGGRQGVTAGRLGVMLSLGNTLCRLRTLFTSVGNQSYAVIE